MRQFVSLALVLCLGAPLIAAEREVIRTDWSRFQQMVSDRKLLGRSAHVRLKDGREVKGKVQQITDAGIALGSPPEVPRAEIASVRFDGKLGHRGLWGMLIGGGGGAAIGGAIKASSDVTEGPVAILIPASIGGLALIGGLIGYLIGRASAPHAPEFVLQP